MLTGFLSFVATIVILALVSGSLDWLMALGLLVASGVYLCVYPVIRRLTHGRD